MSIELVLLSRVAYHGQEIAGPRLRGLLALLAGDLRAGCGTARLVDGLWPDERPENPAKALQILVSRARAQLGSDVIARTASGYRLSLTEDQVDSSAVLLSASVSAKCCREGDHAGALAHADAGLALWAGAATDGDIEAEDPLSALRADRASTCRSLVRTRALALSRLGRGAEAVEPLTELFREHPRDEEVLLELLRAEAATLGSAAALARYETYRRSLRDEIGTDPGTALQGVYQELLRSAAPTVRHGVQHEPNPLLGRDDDLAAVAGLLRTARVTSIVGPGGLGKTRFAHAVSRRAEQRVVRFVALAGVTRDQDVAGEVASALDAEFRRPAMGAVTPDVITAIAGALEPGPALLVLDNCEQVVGGVAELVRTLVSVTRDLRVLATSRAPLRLSSESVYLLPELDLPTSVELFTERARAARPGVHLPSEIAAELCHQLDGLPLAVELAAARARVMSVAEIAQRLDDRFSLLRGGARDTPERHHALHAVVEWSWKLLDPDGQAAMRALSVFPGGFTVDSARQLLGGGDVLPVLEHLVDQSLLKVVETPCGTRFRMLETVREFSTAALHAAGETPRTIELFLAWAREFGLANHELPFGPDPVQVTDLIRAEQDNLVQALRYGIAGNDGATVSAAGAVLAALWTFESRYGRMAALSEDAGRVLSHYRPEPEFVEATRLTASLCAAYTFMTHGPRATRSLIVLRRLPPAPPDTLTRAVAALLHAAPDLDPARLPELCDCDEPLFAGAANAVASYLWESMGDTDGTLKAAERMREVLEHWESPWLRIFVNSRVAELHMQAGRGAEALRHLRVAWSLQRSLGNRGDEIGIRWAMALASLQVGALDDVEHWMELARAHSTEGTLAYRSFELALHGELRLARGDVEPGLELWRRAVQAIATLPGVRAEPGLEPWILEIKAVAVVAHARHNRLDVMEEVVDDVSSTLVAMLGDSGGQSPSLLLGMPLCGALLLAMGMVYLTRGEPRSGARLVALAERFRYLRQFQPTMSAARAREFAERTDKPAYADAVSSCAGLNGEELRAAALAALTARGPG